MCVDLQKFLDGHAITYFSAAEITLLPRKGIYEVPPSSLWDAIVPTLMMADEIRKRWGTPIMVVSGYRPDWYNDLVGGEDDSQHKSFKAVDLAYPAHKKLEFISLACAICQKWIDEGHEVGLGLYASFLHIDVGHHTRFWTG